MRLTGLLAVILFLAIVLFAAPAASYGQTSAPAATVAANRTPPLLDRDTTSQQAQLSRRALSDEERDGVCYTMRTYVVARESRDSDVTRPKAYHECLPEWKVQMRTTERILLPDSTDAGPQDR